MNHRTCRMFLREQTTIVKDKFPSIDLEEVKITKRGKKKYSFKFDGVELEEASHCCSYQARSRGLGRWLSRKERGKHGN